MAGGLKTSSTNSTRAVPYGGQIQKAIINDAPHFRGCSPKYDTLFKADAKPFATNLNKVRLGSHYRFPGRVKKSEKVISTCSGVTSLEDPATLTAGD